MQNINNATNFDFFKVLLETLPHPVFYKDRAGYYRFCNSAFANFLGLEVKDIIDKTVYDISPYELAKVYEEHDQAIFESRQLQIYEAQTMHSDGTIHNVIFSKALHYDSYGEPIGLIGLIQDITARKSAEKEIEMLHTLKDAFLLLSQRIISYQNETEFLNDLLKEVQNIFSQSQQSTVLELDDNETLKVVAFTGYETVDMFDFSIPLAESFILSDLRGKFHQAHIVNDIDAFTLTGHQPVALPVSKKPVQSTLVVPVWINDKLKWIFAIDSSYNHVYTETDRKVADYIREQLPLFYKIYELYMQTLHLSQYDALTGLINRRYFDEKHQMFFNDVSNIYTLALFDLDGLKHINDQFGHQAGDVYLTTFSNWLKQSGIEGMYFARLGGDEFACLFPFEANTEIMTRIIAFRKSFESTIIETNDSMFYGSFSFGLATFPNDTTDKMKLFHIADTRLYKDKRR